jgi:hypothetical protein
MAAAILDAGARGDIESTQITEVSGSELLTNARVLVTRRPTATSAVGRDVWLASAFRSQHEIHRNCPNDRS